MFTRNVHLEVGEAFEEIIHRSKHRHKEQVLHRAGSDDKRNVVAPSIRKQLRRLIAHEDSCGCVRLDCRPESVQRTGCDAFGEWNKLVLFSHNIFGRGCFQEAQKFRFIGRVESESRRQLLSPLKPRHRVSCVDQSTSTHRDSLVEKPFRLLRQHVIMHWTSAGCEAEECHAFWIPAEFGDVSLMMNKIVAKYFETLKLSTNLNPLQSHSLILEAGISGHAQFSVVKTQITESSKPKVERDKRHVLLDDEVRAVNVNARRSAAVKSLVDEDHHRIRCLRADVVREDVNVKRVKATLELTSRCAYAPESWAFFRAVADVGPFLRRLSVLKFIEMLINTWDLTLIILSIKPILFSIFTRITLNRFFDYLLGIASFPLEALRKEFLENCSNPFEYRSSVLFHELAHIPSLPPDFAPWKTLEEKPPAAPFAKLISFRLVYSTLCERLVKSLIVGFNFFSNLSNSRLSNRAATDSDYISISQPSRAHTHKHYSSIYDFLFKS